MSFSFTCFSELPPEIRIVIWRLAEPDRILTVKHIHIRQDGLGPSDIQDSFSIHQPQRPLSQVNREARKETSVDYIHWKSAEFGGELRNDVHYNPHRDTIAFTGWSFKSACWKAFIKIFSNRDDLPIERLAFDMASFPAEWREWCFLFSMMRFPHLQELFLTMGPDDVTRTGLGSELEAACVLQRKVLDRVSRWLSFNRKVSLIVPVVKWMTIWDEDGAYFALPVDEDDV